MTKARIHSRNALPSPRSWKYVASLRKSTVMVRFSRVWRAALRMRHPLGRWSLQMMTQDGGMTAQLQGDHEGCRGSNAKSGGICMSLLLWNSLWLIAVDPHRGGSISLRPYTTQG